MDFTTNNTPTQFGQELAYDLRSIYANQILGSHLIEIAFSRKEKNYSEYFSNLKDLHVVVKHKFKKKDDEDKYIELLNKAIALANKYPEVWIGNLKEPNACALIEDCLNEIEIFFYQKIDDANMFGSNRRIEGL